MTQNFSSDTASRSRHRILLVDDNPSIHEDIRKILCPTPTSDAATDEMEAVLFGAATPVVLPAVLELDSAFQGQEALEKLLRAKLEGRPYSLAFVDVRMPPGWDGIETISRLWEADPRLQVVVCTAYSDYSWDEMHAKVGNSDNLVLLKKPFDNAEVQQLAFAMVRKWEVSRAAEMRLDELETRVQTRTHQLQEANENLTRSEERFAKAFNNSSTAMAIQSWPDGRFVDANDRMTQLTGYRRDELLGQSAAGLFMWINPQAVDAWSESASRFELVRDKETEIRHHSGSLRQVLVSLSPISLSGQSHVLLVIQDITERNLLERQLRQAQKMEGIGQLAAGIAHDFNNILTVIQGHAGMINNQGGDPFTSKSAEQIVKASNRASTLIRQLLMFSRKQVMRFGYLDLNDAVNNSLSMLHRMVGEHVQLEFCPAQRLPSIHADGSMLEQIVMNLAVNARDAMTSGGRVKISTEVVAVNREVTPVDPEVRQGDYVRLSFADTGCGMEAAILGRIFEPFFTTKEVGKGTGLGLATVFGIVRQHRGWVEVQSQVGQGTTFYIYFPACQLPVDQAQAAPDAARLAQGRETILVAEDEDSLREFVTTLLTTQGYRVLAAASGVEALKMYEQSDSPVDLLLTDMVMPGGVMGPELAERLKAAAPKLKVIYTSGYSPGMAGKDLSLLERRNFLPKPYSVGKLASFVREVLDQSPQATDQQITGAQFGTASISSTPEQNEPIAISGRK